MFANILGSRPRWWDLSLACGVGFYDSNHEQRGRSANGIELHPNWWIYGRHAPRMASRSHEHSEAAADPHVRLQYRILLRQMIGTATPHGLQERLTSGLF
jgi:hypothetical protein